MSWNVRLFLVLVYLTLLTPFVGAPSWLYPWLTLKVYYLAILLELLLPLYVYLVVRYPEYRPTIRNPLTISILLFWACATISDIFGISPWRSLWGTLERPGDFHLVHLVLFYFYLQLLNHLDTRHVRRYFQLLAVTGGLSAVYGILEVATRNHFILRDEAYPYISATFGNPIFFAGYLIVPAFIALFFAVQSGNRRVKIGFGALATLHVACVLLTQKKGAAVAIAVTFWLVLILIGFSWTGKSSLKYLRLAALGLPLVAGFAAFVAAKESSNLSRQVAPSAAVRFQLWRDALRAAKEHPVLGTGAENFYVIEARYFQPEIYRYETGWVDKPHNAVLEVLATHGIVGLASFGGMLICAFAILFKEYRADSIRGLSVLMLGAALLAYELQDLFAFDTISEYLAFYSLLGLIGTLRTVPARFTARRKPKSGLPWAAAGAAAVVVIVFCGLNLRGLKYYVDVSFGSLYSKAFESGKAERYFESARSSLFQYDPVELGAQYHLFASRVVSMPVQSDVANRIVGQATAAEEEAVRRFPESAASWLRLSDLCLVRDRLEKPMPSLECARRAMTAGIRLSPNRPEPALLRVRFLLRQNDLTGAWRELDEILRKFPTCGEALMQSAVLARLSGNEEQAAHTAWMAMLNGYAPRNRAELAWLGVYHTDRRHWLLAAQIYEAMIGVGPKDPDDLWQLAQLYGIIGKIPDAIVTAQAVLKIDTKREAAVREFTESLRNGTGR